MRVLRITSPPSAMLHRASAYAPTEPFEGTDSGTSVRRCGGLYAGLANFVRHPQDAPGSVHKKVVWLTFMVVSALCWAAGFVGTRRWSGQGFAYTCVGSFAALLPIFLGFVVTKRLPGVMQGMVVVLMVVSMTLMDLYVMSTLWRMWPLFVIVVDVLLLLGAPRWASLTVIAWALLWLAVAEMEFAFRFGLLDAPGHLTYEERRERWSCERPPCAQDDAFNPVLNLLPQYCVLLLDFYMTRSFADQAKREQLRVQASITAAQHVAASLAHFDLDAAEQHVNDDAAHLPDALRSSFTTLLSNLASYRPYLPEEFFTQRSGAGCYARSLSSDPAPLCPTLTDSVSSAMSPPSGSTTDVPGLVGGRAALAYVSVHDAATLWADNAESLMRQCLHMYRQHVRRLFLDVGGYEVRSIGETFMIAFGSAQSAVEFGLRLQNTLAKGRVVSPLLRRSTDSDGFSVFAVSIGVHYGPCIVERSALTRQYEYFGKTVNTVLVIEANGIPGAVVVSQAVMDNLAEPLSQDVTISRFAEPRPYDGGSGMLALTALLPGDGKHLEACVRSICDARAVASAASDAESERYRSALDLGTPVVSASASVGAIKFAFCTGGVEWDAECALISEQLQRLTSTLSMTGGLLSAVVNSTAYVSWGVFDSRTQHAQAAARFITALCRVGDAPDHKSDAQAPFHAGIASGPLASGTLCASKSQRFVTLVGPCVDMSLALCTGAAELGTIALFACANGCASATHPDSFLACFMRPVEEWMCPVFATSSQPTSVVVWKLMCQALIKSVNDVEEERGPAEVEDGATVAVELELGRAKLPHRMVCTRWARRGSLAGPMQGGGSQGDESDVMELSTGSAPDMGGGTAVLPMPASTASASSTPVVSPISTHTATALPPIPTRARTPSASSVLTTTPPLPPRSKRARSKTTTTRRIRVV